MITLNCRSCDEQMESQWFEADDIVICPDCWGDFE